MANALCKQQLSGVHLHRPKLLPHLNISCCSTRIRHHHLGVSCSIATTSRTGLSTAQSSRASSSTDAAPGSLRVPLLRGPALTPSRSSSPTGDADTLQAICRSFDPNRRGGSSGSSTTAFKFNTAYAVIFAGFGALFLLRSPYIFALLSILTIIPQNSAITSLNSLVIIAYESGLFMNFAEAVYCVRLITWLSIICTLVSFAIFS